MILLHCTFWQNVSNVVGAGPREGVGCAAADSAKSLARFAVRHFDAIFGIVSAARCDHMMLPAHATRS